MKLIIKKNLLGILLIILLMVIPSTKAGSQSLDIYHMDYDAPYNYIKNPSFEDFRDCPTARDQLHKSLHWQRVIYLLDSPDYFHRCSEPHPFLGYSRVGVPENSSGNQEPRTGDAYAGIIVFGDSYYKEYIQTKLKKPLSEGGLYVIGMHVSLANRSKFAGDRFTFCFTKEANIKIKSRVYKGIIDDFLICPNPVRFKSDTLLTDTTGWMNIRVEFTANGGEKYLTIGVFKGDIKWWERWKLRRKTFNPDWKNYENVVPYAFYYIDDVYLIRKENYLNTMQNDAEE